MNKIGTRLLNKHKWIQVDYTLSEKLGTRTRAFKISDFWELQRISDWGCSPYIRTAKNALRVLTK
jgi:hypothetical protein